MNSFFLPKNYYQILDIIFNIDILGDNTMLESTLMDP